MTKILETAFEEIVITTLEKIAFLFMDPIPLEGSPSELDLQTRIQFEGPFSRGSTLFSADLSFAKEMAAGLLGIEPEEVHKEDAEAAMKELTNIIAGELILRLGARKDEFYLGLPELLKPGSLDLNNSEEGESLWFHFESDEGRLSCQVNVIEG
jgi:CheY-specific phosphatase CheX